MCGGKTAAGKCATTDTTVHQWIDGVDCPEIGLLLDTIPQLKMAGFASPDDLDRRTTYTVVDEAPLVTVTGPPDSPVGLDATVSLSETTGPAASWWFRTKDDLKRCWRDAPVMVDGRALPARLTGE